MSHGPQAPSLRRRPGPRRSLDETQVVDAALDLLDGGGAGALSIRAVAARLGVNPNAIYTYVADRAALERAVVERVLAEAGLERLSPSGRSWRTRVLGYAAAVRRALLRHPGAVPLFMTAPMTGPNALAVGERLLEALHDGGIDADDAARATYAVIVLVLGSVALEVAETDGRPPLPPERERIARRRAELGEVDAAHYPRTAAASATMAGWISEHQLRWSLGRLLDGLSRDTAAQQRRSTDDPAAHRAR